MAISLLEFLADSLPCVQAVSARVSMTTGPAVRAIFARKWLEERAEEEEAIGSLKMGDVFRVGTLESLGEHDGAEQRKSGVVDLSSRDKTS